MINLIRVLGLDQTIQYKSLSDFPGTHTFQKSFTAVKDHLENIHVENIAVAPGLLKFLGDEFNCPYYTKMLRERLFDIERKREIAHNIAKRGHQFSEYLHSITSKNDSVVRLSINLHHQDISKKFPICLIYGSIGTPWHHSPKVHSTTLKVTMGGISADDCVVSENLSDMEIKWVEKGNLRRPKALPCYGGWN